MRRALVAASLLSGCAALEPTSPSSRPRSAINEDPYPSTYVRYPGVPTVIRHATVFDGDGQRFDDGTVVFADGVDPGGRRARARRRPPARVEIDGTGKFVTPGIIDIHSHLGDYPSPGVSALFGRQRSDLAGAARSLGRA